MRDIWTTAPGKFNENINVLYCTLGVPMKIGT